MVAIARNRPSQQIEDAYIATLAQKVSFYLDLNKKLLSKYGADNPKGYITAQALGNVQGAITLTTTGTSGAATLAANVLNIPQYQAAGTYVTSLTVTTNQGVSGSFSAGATPALTLALGALTGVTSLNGLVVTANTGVITTGTWSATNIAPNKGGTGVANNAASTLTISGAFATTLTLTNTTSVTLPTSGTLATLAGTEALTNKTIGDTNTVTLKDTLFTLQDDGDTSKQLQFQLSGITTATTRTLTIPNASDTLAVLATAQTFSNGVKTFNSSIMAFRNPADTFSYTIVASAIAANRNLTLPLLTANDTLVALAVNNTFTGSNTFTATSGLTCSLTSITTTATHSLDIYASNPATAGTPVRYSPSQTFLGRAWDTAGGGSAKSHYWRTYVKPVSGNPTTSSVVLSQSFDDSTYTDILEYNNSGDVSLKNVGGGIRIKQGSNATQGRAVLVGGTVTVNTTKSTTTMEVFAQHRIVGGTVGVLTIGTVTAGTSFVINSSNILDTSTICWWISEPSA